MHRITYENLGFNNIKRLEDFLDRDEVKELIGKNYNHYKELWLDNFNHAVNGMKKRKIKRRMNWLALISPLIWYGYRKMYGAMMAMIAALAAVTFAEVYYGFDIPARAYIALSTLLLITSKDAYFHHIVNSMKKADAMVNKEERKNYLRSRAGVSVFWAVLSLPLLAAVLYIAMHLASVMSGNPL